MPTQLTKWLQTDNRSDEQPRRGKMSRGQRIGVFLFVSGWIGSVIVTIGLVTGSFASLLYVLG